MTLEVLTCDHPYRGHQWPDRPSRVVPAEWWLAKVSELSPSWSSLGAIGVVGAFRMAVYNRRHYWPLRIVTKRGRVVWRSRAAKGVANV